MNKQDLIVSISDKFGISKAEARKIVDHTLDEIKGAVKRGEPVTLMKFGSFKKRVRASRTGINPATGERILIPSKEVVKFKPSPKILD